MTPNIIRCALKPGHECGHLWIIATSPSGLGECQAQPPKPEKLRMAKADLRPTPSTDVRDFNAQLRRSIARETLAQAIYEARATAYCASELPLWKTLSHESRERYREVADATLVVVKPQPRGLPPVVVTGLRPTHGRVIGAIGVGEAS